MKSRNLFRKVQEDEVPPKPTSTEMPVTSMDNATHATSHEKDKDLFTKLSDFAKERFKEGIQKIPCK